MHAMNWKNMNWKSALAFSQRSLLVMKADATPTNKRWSSSQKNGRNSPHPPKNTASEIQCQDNDHLFFHANNTVQSELVPNTQTINQEFYQQVPNCLQDAVRFSWMKNSGFFWFPLDLIVHYNFLFFFSYV